MSGKREVGWPTAIAIGLVAFLVIHLLMRRSANEPGAGQPATPGSATPAAPGSEPAAPPPGAARRALGVETRQAEDGLLVAAVRTGGAAMAAGVLPGDVLLSASGLALTRGADGSPGVQRLHQALNGPEEPLRLIVRRGAERLELLVAEAKEGTLELPLADELIRAAADQLLALRRPDGHWPSYLQKDLPGPAVTALAAWALSRAPEHPGAAEAHSAALDLLLSDANRTRDGAPSRGVEDRFAPHPHRTYATALTLLAAARTPGREAAVKELAGWLAWAQLGEANGVGPFDGRHGGWSYYDDHQGHDGLRRRADVSTARFAIQALGEAGCLTPADPTAARAELFLDAIQNLSLLSGPTDAWRMRERSLRDGGFAFTPFSSKAGPGEGLEGDQVVVYPSYGTATSDGVLALLVARGIDRRAATDARLDLPDLRARAGLLWLASRFDLLAIPGFPDDRVGWRRSMLFYWWASLAETLHRAGVWQVRRFDGAAHAWAPELVRTLKNHHMRRGNRFAGESRLMHEDDPTIAAAFALVALAAARERLRLGSGADLVAAEPPPPAPIIEPGVGGDVRERGRARFAACAVCHKDDGAGNGPSLVGIGDLYRGRFRGQAAAQLAAWMRDPRPGSGLLRDPPGRWPGQMPPTVLAEQEMDELVSWLLTKSAGIPVSEDR